MTRAVKVRDLEKGDKIVFGKDTTRTVKHCVESSIDPVYLIYFEESDESIAKGLNDTVMIEV